jgi:hypothetical protein
MSIRIHVTTDHEADAIWRLLCAGDLQHDAEIVQDGIGSLGLVVRRDGRLTSQRAAQLARTVPSADGAGS